MRVTTELDQRRGWDRLPKPVALLTLIGLRMSLRRQNLFDTTGESVGWGPELPPSGPRSMVRTPDGTGTDPLLPAMGSAGTRFGRNVPIESTYPQGVLTPNPRTISLELLARKEFIPATTLNLLVASWLQFEVHDWMSHGTNEVDDPWEIDLGDDDPWPVHPMQIRRTQIDTTSDGGPPTYRNTETHWWDASQVYGSSPIIEKMIRTNVGGRLKLTPNGNVPFDPPSMPPIPGLDIAGVTGNWWLGLAMMHTLFMREHNAICDFLASLHPKWNDQELFDHARLINAALIAKIHTVEWTPALLADADLELGMRVNWWGFQGEWLLKHLGRLTKSEEFSGVPGSQLYYHGEPYSMTEEFVSVYRMHPLIPDEYSLRKVIDDRVIEEMNFTQLAGVETHNVLDDTRIEMNDLFYSFGTSHPGAIVLHNYPNRLREFHEPDGTIIDLAATDILRNRERGVPRYNEFRRKFRLRPAATFEEFSADPGVVADLRRIYGDVEEVDLMVGLFAEAPPEGFAFSDTAFRVFILMATRRIKSDRFYTYDYRPEVYTKEGIEWIENNTMKSVLLRHFPNLHRALAEVDNAFKPWRVAAGP
ncbi:MAG TPA: peroxidase family protein [Acidimicrobiales bacterium]|nr:peroxidase family protein [Acidimicrobiales bacterium]